MSAGETFHTGVQIEAQDDFGGPQFEVAIYRTVSLDDNLGQLPEEEVVRHLTFALDQAGINYRIYHNFEPAALGNQSTGTCVRGEDAYYDWLDLLDASAPFIAADANLCLLDQDGGGCGGQGGNACVSGAAAIDQSITIRDGTSHHAANLYAALHEIGHNMGFAHSPHPGDAWNENNEWNKTPNVGSETDTANVCGERIEPKQNEAERLWTVYHGCVAEHIENDDVPEATVTLLDAPTDIVAGEPTTITAMAQNRTPVDVVWRIPLLVNGEEIRRFHFTLDPFASEVRTHEWAPETPGFYTIELAGASIQREVVPQGEVRVTGIETSPSEPTVGEATHVTVTAENTTPDATVATFEVVADRGVNRPTVDIGTATISLSSGATGSDTLTWVPTESGTWTIEAGDEAVTVGVSEPDPGDIRIERIGLTNPPARVGKTALINVEALNRGGSPRTRTVNVFAGGTKVATLTFTLEPGERQFRSVEWVPESTGIKTLRAGGAETLVDVEAGSGGGPPPEPPVEPGDPIPALAIGNGLLTVGALVAAPEGALR